MTINPVYFWKPINEYIYNGAFHQAKVKKDLQTIFFFFENYNLTPKYVQNLLTQVYCIKPK